MAATSRSVRYGNRRALSAALANMADARRLARSALPMDYPGVLAREACLSGSPREALDCGEEHPMDEIATNDSTVLDEVESESISDDRNVDAITASHTTSYDEAVKAGNEALVFVYGHNANLYAIFGIDEPESFDCETERQLQQSFRTAKSQLDLVVQCHPKDRHAAATVCGYKTSYHIPPMMFIDIKYDALQRAYDILMNEASREEYEECRREFGLAAEPYTREGPASHSSNKRCLWADDQSQVSECASQVSECPSQESSMYGEHGDYSYDDEPERANSNAEAFGEADSYDSLEEDDGRDQGEHSQHVYESLPVGQSDRRGESGEEKKGNYEADSLSYSINDSMHSRPTSSLGNSTNSRRYVISRDSSMRRPRATVLHRRQSSGVSSRLDYSVSCDEDECEKSCQSGSEDSSSLAYSYGEESLSHASTVSGESLSHASEDFIESRCSQEDADWYHVASPTPAKSEGLPQRSPTDPMEFERLITESLPPDEYYNQLTNRGKQAYHQLYNKRGLNPEELAKPTIFDPFDLHENKAEAPSLDTFPRESIGNEERGAKMPSPKSHDFAEYKQTSFVCPLPSRSVDSSDDEEELLKSRCADKQSMDMSVITECDEKERVSGGFPDVVIDGSGSASDSQNESFATVTLNSNEIGSSASKMRSKRGIKSKVRSIIKSGVSFSSSGRRRGARLDPEGSVASSTAGESIGSKARDIDCFDGVSVISHLTTDIDCFEEDQQLEDDDAYFQPKQSCLEPSKPKQSCIEPGGTILPSMVDSNKVDTFDDESVDTLKQKDYEMDDMLGIDTFTPAKRPIKAESTEKSDELKCFVDEEEIKVLLAISSTFTAMDDADDDVTSTEGSVKSLKSVRFADEVDDAISQVSTKSDGANIKSCLRKGKTYRLNDSAQAAQEALNEKALLDCFSADVEEERMRMLMTVALSEGGDFDEEEAAYMNSRSAASSSGNRWNVLVVLDSCIDSIGSGLDNSLMSLENFCTCSKRACI